MSNGDRRKERLIVGTVAAALWAAHAAEGIARGEAADLLWMCNVAGALLAAGWWLGSPRAIAVSASWLALGVPLWALDLATGGEIRATSVASHLGGLALATLGVARLGWPRRTSAAATAALAALVALTRALLPPAGNVNLAFAVWPGWEGLFPHHGVYLAAMASLAAACFAALEAAVTRLRRG